MQNSHLSCITNQTDITHRSVFELIHSEDRDELIHQMRWNSMIPSGGAQAAASATACEPADVDGLACKQPSQMSLREILNSGE